MDISTLECFSYVQQEFLICITVHKAMNLIQFNCDTYVKITVDKISKTTNVFENSENPIYNEYFVFELLCTLPELLRLTVLFEVKRKAKIKRDTVLGELFVDLATVWSQQNHSFYKKWGKLENPIKGRPSATLRGHLQIDLSIISKNEPPAPAVFDDRDFDDIEKNLLQPTIEQEDIFSVQYNVIIYKGAFIKKLDYLIQVSFAGMNGKTKVQKSKTHHEWNEQITFTWSYPALSQTFLFQVMVNEATHWKCVADHEIHFDEITFPGQLPSVGPTYIYLYDSADTKSYVGRVLMAIRTENIKGKESIPQRFAKTFPVPLVSEKLLCGTDNFLVECLIWQGDFLHIKSNSIKFGLNCGEYSSQAIECQPHTHTLTNLRFFQQEKPYKTIYLNAILPDCRCKFEADHFLLELVHIIKTEMDYFKLFELKYNGKGQLHAKCLKALVTLFREKLTQGKYRLLYNGFKQLTDWDKNRLHFLEQFYNNFQKELDNYRKSLKSKNPECLSNVSKVYKDLLIKTKEIDAIIASRVQDNLPDLILNVCVGSKVIAYSKFNCRQFMYAQRKECRGMLCGKRHNILLKPTTCPHTCRNCGCVFGKIDAWIWIGTDSERNDQMEKEGWTQQEPFFYNFNEMRNFDCKLYIHQAKIRPGGDKTGLCDAAMRVTFFHLAADTSTVYTSLSPVWDEVISFHNISLPGRPESYLENPPMVALEVIDRDSKKSSDLLGNGFIRLSVKLLECSSSPLQQVYEKAIGKEDAKNKLSDYPLWFKKILKTKDIVQQLKDLCRMSPPPLKWVSTSIDGTTFVEILMSGELIENNFDGEHSEAVSVSKGIPPQICPSNKLYRISAFFAGIRNFNKAPNLTARKYKIKIMFGDFVMYTGVSASKLNISINFSDPYAAGIMPLPEQLEYWPAIVITHVDVSHKKEITVGAALISKSSKYLEAEYDPCESSIATNFSLEDSDLAEVETHYEENTPLLKKEKSIAKKIQCLDVILKFFQKYLQRDKDISNIDYADEKTFNWWTKFYNSIRKNSQIAEENVFKHQLIIYPNELENQPEFGYFQDWAEPIPLAQGIIKKKHSPPKDDSYCILKCKIRVKSCIESFTGRSESEKSLEKEFHSKYQELSNFLTEIKVVVRVYIVQGLKLRSKDRYSQSDAYVSLQFGAQKISDRANYVLNQANPIFGKRFQMDGLIPREHILHISVYDHDVQDDLIGSTCIDLEDRLRSRHYASFGIPNEYCSTGYNVWRNSKSPYNILKEICNNYGIAPPEFRDTQIIVAGIAFEDSTKIAKNEDMRERLSLSVLKKLEEIPQIGFKLVPEHVETRSLYRSDRPGIEQGKLQLWVEIFEADKVPAPIDITPISAKKYELRVIVHNTKDVIMDEKNLFGKSMSDIYIKAWVEDIDAAQLTDVHYRSLNGEGNFNWRMIFPIRYSKNEEMMVIMKKQNIFDRNKTEEKCLPILFMQIWDNDAISADDFLGALNLNLTHCPMPCNKVKNCTLKVKPIKYLNLFKVKKIRGWFPATGKTKDGSVGLTGKVELEMQILTESEAEANPAGKGRDPPNALPAPKYRTLQRINHTMPNLFNGFHIGNREVSPNFTRSATLATEQTENRRKKYRKLWMLHKLKPLSSPESVDVESPHGADGNELETILPNEDVNRQEVCLLRDSPYRILRAAESGNLEDFIRLYQGDNSRLSVQDGKGRTAAHQAAARNRVNILQFIHEKEGNFNAQDNAGNTPLHVAVENDSLDALDYLLSINANTNILNEKKQAPVHLATEMNKVKVLQVMGKHRGSIDIQQGGEHGRTALHLAAIYDHEECARILITEFGACPRKPCNNGYYPIHEAAKNASSKTMEVFFQWGESRGCTREEMISFYDSEGNVPLHSAVHGGDIKAVELCLKSGAKISTQQHDLSTPVHLACAQGAIDIVKLMFSMQPLEKKICLGCTDVQKMTPLHCASMFDHPEIVEFLVAEGADLNALDKEHRSPLLLAASRSGWKTVNSLTRLGANISIKDSNHRNVLHFVIMNGGRLAEFSEEVSKTQSKTQLVQLLNEKDNTGCSPLHYASREGHIRSLENLIRLGACINLKNNNNESPLHFAARYGRYNTVRQLLDSEKGSFIINESDGEGLTPLHIASQQGHTRVVQLLLNRGALLHRDHNGRNPLHLAAMSGYTQTMELLHSVHSHLLDQVDKDGNTALHLATMENKPNSISILLSMGCKLLYNSMDMSAIDYAIYYKYPEAALAMVTHEERAVEVMALKSDKHPCVTLALIASMPRVFEAVQDKCITKANCKKDSKSFYIKYSFRPYQRSEAEIDKQRKALNDPKWRPPPLCVANTMVSHGRVELLAHPLSQKYLQMKWNSYGKYFHLTNLLFYSVFLIFVTLFSSQMMNNIDIRNSTTILNLSPVKEVNGTDNFTTTPPRPISMPYYDDLDDEKDEFIIKTTGIVVSGIAIIVYISLNSIREVVQMYQQKLHYILEVTNIISWVLHISALIMVWPVFFGDGKVANIHYSAASITVFLSWFRLLLFLQRFDQVGIYVVMFLEILQTLIKVLLVFSILIIAFGLAFFILLSKISNAQANHLSFSNIPMSLLRTFSMMLGELDFVGTYVNPFYQNQLKMAIPSFLILSIFMILMPILLMNLLIGLAVGDIESVRRNAQLKRLAMQVVLHTELERKLPQMWLERVDKKELIEYPNDTKCKLGFLDSVLRKWFYNPFSEDSGMDMPFDNNDDYVTAEIDKQKRKLREISRVLDQQHQLLRLIVQKMEIKTEADDVDEGVSPTDLRPLSAYSTGSSKWTSPRIRKKLRTALSFSRNSN